MRCSVVWCIVGPEVPLQQKAHIPDVLMSLHIQAVEVVVLYEALLSLLVFAVLQPLHDGQLHLHGDVDREHRLQQALLYAHTHRNTVPSKSKVTHGQCLRVQRPPLM